MSGGVNIHDNVFLISKCMLPLMKRWC